MKISDVSSLIAVILSLVAIFYNRKGFHRSFRPFVWCGNWIVFRGERTCENIPSTVGFRVGNAPAKIKRVEIKIYEQIGEKQLFKTELRDLIRHPDDKIQWTYSNMSKNHFEL